MLSHRVIVGVALGCLVAAAPVHAYDGSLVADSLSLTASALTVRVGHRLYPQFGERVETEMQKLEPIGDTDMSFEVAEFYPHFAYLDSSKTYVSLSDEPVNPAFRIKVYEDGELVDQVWAFFSIKVPHFPSDSYVYFEVLEFAYRGERYRQEEETRAD